MKSRDDILSYLTDIGAAPVTTDHEAVFRVGEGEGIKEEIAGAHTKNLFLKDAKGRIWLISAKDDTVIDLKRLHTVIGSARLSFGSAELMFEVLGVTPGSVTALALINDAQGQATFVLDKALAEADQVNFHPLINTATTTLTQGDFRKFLTSLEIVPLVVDFPALTLDESIFQR